MKTAFQLASIGLLAAAVSAPALASVGAHHGDGAARHSLEHGAPGIHAAWARVSDAAARRDHDRDRRHDRKHAGDRPERGMKEIAAAAGPGEPGQGWRYFSDPAARRAVVISPQGEYYFSRGKGLRLVAPAQAGS